MEVESNPSTHLLDLPNEILIKILNHLDAKEVFYSVALVCRRFMGLADEALSNISILYSNDISEDVEIYFVGKNAAPFVNDIKYKKRLLHECQPLISPLTRRIKYANLSNVNPIGPYGTLAEIKGFNNLVDLRICDLSKEPENTKQLINFLNNHKNVKELDLSLHIFDLDQVDLIMNSFKSLNELNLFVRDIDFWIAYQASKSIFSYRAIVINEKILKTFENVRDLAIVSYYNSDNDKDLQVVFKNMVNLIAFRFTPIRGAWLTDYGLTGVDLHGRKTGYSISKFINMEILSLNQCPNLTDMSLLEFRFPKLKVLEVNYSKKFTERAIQYIVKHSVHLTDLLLNSDFQPIPLFDEATLERVYSRTGNVN